MEDIYGLTWEYNENGGGSFNNESPSLKVLLKVPFYNNIRAYFSYYRLCFAIDAEHGRNWCPDTLDLGEKPDALTRMSGYVGIRLPFSVVFQIASLLSG